jgi:DNA-binding CsgD family transcriptional regulator
VTSVLICDDRRAARLGLIRAVRAVPGLRTIVAPVGQLCIRYRLDRPNVVVVGGTSGGIAAATRLLAEFPRAAVLLSGLPADSAPPAGVRGGFSVDGYVGAALVAMLSGPNGNDAGLSPRELQVLRAMGRGCSNAEISRELFLAEDTVKVHVRRLFRKLGVRDRAAAVARGFRAGLLD